MWRICLRELEFIPRQLADAFHSLPSPRTSSSGSRTANSSSGPPRPCPGSWPLGSVGRTVSVLHSGIGFRHALRYGSRLPRDPSWPRKAGGSVALSACSARVPDGWRPLDDSVSGAGAGGSFFRHQGPDYSPANTYRLPESRRAGRRVRLRIEKGRRPDFHGGGEGPPPCIRNRRHLLIIKIEGVVINLLTRPHLHCMFAAFSHLKNTETDKSYHYMPDGGAEEGRGRSTQGPRSGGR